MSLTSGATLGPYSVTAQIGAGGMARSTASATQSSTGTWPSRSCRTRSPPIPTAWRASSAKPKCSPRSTIPNIGHIYGLEEAEGTKALVLELVEGTTLADRIAEGPIPVEDLASDPERQRRFEREAKNGQ